MNDPPQTEHEAWSRATEHFGTDAKQLDRRSTELLRNGPAQLSLVLTRYKFLARLATKQRRVCELGIAEALGSRILAEFSASYTGIDADAGFVAEATRIYASLGLRFQTDLAAPTEPQDLVVALDLARAFSVIHADSDESASAIAVLFDHVLPLLADDGLFAIGVNASDLAAVRNAMTKHFAQVLTFSCSGESIVAAQSPRGDYALVIGALPKSSTAPSDSASAAPIAPSQTSVGDAAIVFGPHLLHWLHNSPRRLLHSMSYYRFGSELIGPKLVGPERRVLDVGCGEGIGTWLLAERNGFAVGLDFDTPAIEIAQRNFRDPRVRFLCGDFFEVPAEPYDAVVNFDCIEHILPANVDRFWQRITEHLTPTGMAIVGTPSLASDQYANPATRAGHVNLYSGDRLEAEMARRFRNVFLFCANDETIHTGFRALAHYYIAVGIGPICSGAQGT